MSTNTCTYERFEIQNRNDSTKEVLQKLTEYIYRLNRMEDFEACNFIYLRLNIDEQETSIEISKDPDSDLFEASVLNLLENIIHAKHVVAELDFDLMLRFGAAYGLRFWSLFLENFPCKDDLIDCITYRCLEYYESDPEIKSYYSGRTEQGILIGEPKYTDGLSAVGDISDWYNYNFSCEIQSEHELGTTDERSALMEKIHDFYQSFDDSQGDIDDTDEETYFNISNMTIILAKEHIPEFQTCLQYFYDFAKQHQADFTLCAEFVPNSQRAFAKLVFVPEDDRIVCKAMRY